MSPRKNIKQQLVTAALQSVLDHVVEPGIDELPPAGTGMLDRRGLRWVTTDTGIKLIDTGRGGPREWKWGSTEARYIGPLLNPSRVTPRRLDGIDK